MWGDKGKKSMVIAAMASCSLFEVRTSELRLNDR
jgi:hypothetical protein